MITYGMRIKYDRVNENTFQSRTIFTDGEKVARVVVDKENLQFKLVDPVTGMLHFKSELEITNYEVLQRHVKRALIKVLGVKFTKEKRKVNNGTTK